MKGLLSDINKQYESQGGFFNCKTIQLSQLVNKAFYILDYAKEAKTKFGDGRYVVKVSGRLGDAPELHRKFLTNSSRIKFTLDMLKEKDALPYRVVVQYSGKQYYFEEYCETKIE